MAWDSGTITSATPWPDLSTKLKNLVGGSGVANWSFVENVPAGASSGQSGSTVYSLDVFKCAGSGTNANDAGTDFYVVLPIPVPTSSTTNDPVGQGVGMSAFEDYEGSTNKRFRRNARRSSSSSAPVGSGFWFTDTYGSFSSFVSTSAMDTRNLNTTGFSYWIKLTNNGVIIATRVGSTENTFIAFLADSFVDGSVATDGCPLAIWDDNHSNVYFTRLPGVTDTTLTKWDRGGMTNWNLLFGHNGQFAQDFWQSQKIFTSRVLLLHSEVNLQDTGGNHGADLIGGLRGLWKSDILCFHARGTVALGDTMTIGGTSYTVIGTTMGTCVALGQTNPASGGAIVENSSARLNLVVTPT